MAKKQKGKGLFSPKKQNAVTIQCGKRLVMEEVERVVYCDEEKIVLKGIFSLEVRGKGLKLSELGNHNMEVMGKIYAVTFGEEGEI